MKVLLLAPQPFYEDRGTPIATHMVLKVLSERGDDVDVLTYPEGTDRAYDHVTLHRVKRLPFVHHIRPGFSWKKILCDVLMFFKAVRLYLKNRYTLVHAVEEASFMALVLNWAFGVQYIYDMDSSLPEQLVESCWWMIPFLFIFRFFEKLVVRHAKAVVPVCASLFRGISKYSPKRVEVLEDVSLVDGNENQKEIHLRQELEISGLVIMYVGNLEEYQGIDLLLEAFALAIREDAQYVATSSMLVVIGGQPKDVQKYRKRSFELGVQENVHFLGPRPVEHLAAYLANADILVSPRLKGRNTPMKIYSYLQSGKAILATNLETHTQILDERVAVLENPAPEAFSKGLRRLMKDQALRSKLGSSAKKMFEEKFSYDHFSKKLKALYNEVESDLQPRRRQNRA